LYTAKLLSAFVQTEPAPPPVSSGSEDHHESRNRVQLTQGIVPVLVGLLLWFMPPPTGVKPAGWHLLAIFFAVILGLILQPLPMGAVVLVGVTATIFTGTLSINDALGGYMNSTVWLIVIAFLFARAVAKTGLGRRIAYLFIRLFGHRTLGLCYALGLADMVLAPGIPSGAARTGGIIFPVVKSLAVTFRSEPGPTSSRIGAYLMLSAYQFHAVTCAMFMTAMVANPLIVELTRKTLHIDLDWAGWALAAIVPGLLSFIAIPPVLFAILRPEIRETPEAAELARAELKKLGPLSRHEWLLIGALGIAFVLWITFNWTGLDATAVGMLSLCLLLLSGVMSWRDVLDERSAWDALVWFGGLVGLAAMLAKLGVTSWFSAYAAQHVKGLPWLGALIGLSLVYMYAHYFFASLAAHTTAFFVPFITVAVAAGAPPYMAALVFAFLSSLCACLTHFGGGPAPVYWGSGYLTVQQWWKGGFILSVIHMIVWLGIGPLWWHLIGLF
jgi:DASS family divalent anion:Na+ symporter